MHSSEGAPTWLLLQLADSAFPAGGFAHSAGLEAAVQLGEVQKRETLARFVDDALWQTGHGALPFVTAAHDAVELHGESDASCDTFLTGTVANRASRTQGRAFVASCAEIFGEQAIVSLHAAIRARAVAGHYAPAFGAVTRALGVARVDAQRLFLLQALRAVVSAGVRLGALGPLEGQRWQRARAPLLERVLHHCAALGAADAAQTAPVAEAFASHHDALYSRLFQS